MELVQLLLGGGQLNKKRIFFQGSLKNQMKKATIVGVAAAAIGFVVGSQLPKSGTAGYAVITGTTKDRKAAKEYFQNVNQFTKECGFTTLVLDRNTDIREGDKGPLTVIARHPKGKAAVIKCYESDEYQRLKAIRAPYTDWNFRLTEGKL